MNKSFPSTPLLTKSRADSWERSLVRTHYTNITRWISRAFCHKSSMTPLDLKKLRRRTPATLAGERPKKRVDRFDGLSEEEVQRYTLEDYLDRGLDIVFVGINPSLMAAHRGRYYAGPGNHFYRLLHESGLTPRCVSYEEDYKLLGYGIGLTNVVARATRSAAELKRAEIKEGARIVEEKLRLYRPKVAVFNGKCIYEVYANIGGGRSSFHFGLQAERIGDTAIWVTPSSSARCANYPRMRDKLRFYTALRRYLGYLKGEIADVDAREFRFEGKCGQPVPSTSKMWRRKDISTFLHGGRVVNGNTLRCRDTLSEEDIAAIRTAEFVVRTCEQEDEEDASPDGREVEDRTSGEENISERSESASETERLVASGDTGGDATGIADEKKSSVVVIGDMLNSQESKAHCKNDEKCTSTRNRARSNLRSDNEDDSLDFMSIIKQRLSQKSSEESDSVSARPKIKTTQIKN